MRRMDEVTRRRLATALRLAVLAALVGALIYFHGALVAELEVFTRWVDTLGVFGPLVFIVGYALATVAFVPASLLTVAAGATFGLGLGSVYVFLGASLSACAAFALSRSFARAAIERRLAGNARFAMIDRAIAAEGRKIVFLLRLSPVFPFSLLNYALGLTRVRFADYALACAGMLPGTILYVYLGSVVGAVAAGWRIFGLAVTAVVVVLITRIARNALTRATGDTAQ
jgi:uncharacterized membrane protein YdjX (TVP38/TMEM64 family)